MSGRTVVDRRYGPVYRQDDLGTPGVTLLDARAAGLDAPALRHWARHVAAASGAPYTTRSYRYPYALVAWHSRPVGVDIERVEPCDTPLADLICTPEERVGAAGATDPDGYVTSLWSAKEALAKALGDALAYEPSRLSSPAHWPGGRAGPWRAGQPAAPPGHVAWLCWRSVSSPGASASAGAGAGAGAGASAGAERPFLMGLVR